SDRNSVGVLLLVLFSLFMNLVMEAVERQLKSVGDTEFVVDLGQVVLDYLLSRSQLEGNFLVPLSLGDAGDDRKLFRRKPRLGLGISECSGLRTIGFDHPVHRLIVNPRLAGGDFADTLNQKI